MQPRILQKRSLKLRFVKLISRTASSTLERPAKGFPVVAITGPHQSGKTTLAESVLKDKPCVSLKNRTSKSSHSVTPNAFCNAFPAARFWTRCSAAPNGCRGYKAGWTSAASWATLYSRARRNLTCSQALPKYWQAGRVVRFDLQPLCTAELRAACKASNNLNTTLFQGS